MVDAVSDRLRCPSRFLEVKGCDNDFGWALESALRRIWVFAHESNGHLTDVAHRSIPEMFVELHKAGALASIILRAWVLEHLLFDDVEFNLRGLYWEDVDWKSKRITAPINDTLSDYLSIELEFHDNKLFTDVWKNGEHAWLDLASGESGTF